MKKLTVLVFLVLLCGCAVLTAAAFRSQALISEKENRSLQAFPVLNRQTYLSGTFFKDLEAYIYDHVPLRERVLEYTALYDKIKGIEPEIMALEKGNSMNLVNPDGNAKALKPDKEEKLEPEKKKEPGQEGETPSLPVKPGQKMETDFSQYKTQTQNISIMAVKDTLLQLFHFHEENVGAYAKALNTFAAKMPENVRMYSLLAPTQVGLTGEEYKDFSDPQDKAIEYIYSLLNPRYETIEAFAPLFAHRQEYLYFRSDHHWTQLGAYYAAQAFVRQAGLAMPDIADCEKHSLENFLGYLYSNNQVSKVGQHPDRIDYYIYQGKNPKIECFFYDETETLNSYMQTVFSLSAVANGTNYGIFLSGDYPRLVYKNPESAGGRVLMVVKDSYANAFVPWLIHSFQEIIVIDPRTCKDNIYDLVVKEQVTDFVVLDYIMAADLESFIGMMQQLAEGRRNSYVNQK